MDDDLDLSRLHGKSTRALKSRSIHAQVKLKSRSSHAQVMLKSSSNQDLVKLKLTSIQHLFMIKSRSRQHPGSDNIVKLVPLSFHHRLRQLGHLVWLVVSEFNCLENSAWECCSVTRVMVCALWSASFFVQNFRCIVCVP